MVLGEVGYEMGVESDSACFRMSTVVSILNVMKNGESAEIAVVGNEGIVGISLFMGGGATSSRAVVQNAGRGFRLNTASLLREFNCGGIVMQLLLLYSQALITRMTQTAACNRHHLLDQRLCPWMLLSLDCRRW